MGYRIVLVSRAEVEDAMRSPRWSISHSVVHASKRSPQIAELRWTGMGHMKRVAPTAYARAANSHGRLWRILDLGARVILYAMPTPRAGGNCRGNPPDQESAVDPSVGLGSAACGDHRSAGAAGEPAASSASGLVGPNGARGLMDAHPTRLWGMAPGADIMNAEGSTASVNVLGFRTDAGAAQAQRSHAHRHHRRLVLLWLRCE